MFRVWCKFKGPESRIYGDLLVEMENHIQNFSYCIVTLNQEWMYYIIWIQCCWQAPIHSYESCSVAHESKNVRQ